MNNFSSITLVGGGSKTPIWSKIISSVLDVDVYKVEIEQGPSFGAAILAMVGANYYTNVDEAISTCVKKELVLKKDETLVAKYKCKYETYKQIYPAIKGLHVNSQSKFRF